MVQQDVIYSHPNISWQLGSLSVTFNVHEKLLEYDLPSKVRSDIGSLSREEVRGLIRESEEESREYDREIGRLQTEIEKLKAEVGRLENAILALRKGQKKLDTVTNEFRTALCPGPIRKLPPEILSEIIKLAFPSTETEERPNEVRSDRSSRIKPLSLARTCAH
jgi:septal ring factor EnvC (AmiA/AmiB activator)